MNNKFIKRIAAVVLGVAVLSTCAFATVINESATKYTGNNSVTFSYETTAGDDVSYIAYAVSNGAEGEIVAVGQVDDSAAAGTVSIAIDADKLAYCEAINIYSGDSTGGAKASFKVEEYTHSASAVVEDIVLGGETFEDVATITITATGKNPGTYTLAGLKGIVGGVSKELTKKSDAAFPSIEVGSAGGAINVGNIYLVGLDDAQLAAAGSIDVVPDFTFVAE